MKSKVLSVVVILAFYGYVALGLLIQTPGMQSPEGALTSYELAATLVSFLFGWFGVGVAGYYTIKWILR